MLLLTRPSRPGPNVQLERASGGDASRQIDHIARKVASVKRQTMGWRAVRTRKQLRALNDGYRGSARGLEGKSNWSGVECVATQSPTKPPGVLLGKPQYSLSKSNREVKPGYTLPTITGSYLGRRDKRDSKKRRCSSWLAVVMHRAGRCVPSSAPAGGRRGLPPPQACDRPQGSPH